MGGERTKIELRLLWFRILILGTYVKLLPNANCSSSKKIIFLPFHQKKHLEIWEVKLLTKGHTVCRLNAICYQILVLSLWHVTSHFSSWWGVSLGNEEHFVFVIVMVGNETHSQTEISKNCLGRLDRTRSEDLKSQTWY